MAADGVTGSGSLRPHEGDVCRVGPPLDIERAAAGSREEQGVAEQVIDAPPQSSDNDHKDDKRQHQPGLEAADLLLDSPRVLHSTSSSLQ